MLAALLIGLVMADTFLTGYLLSQVAHMRKASASNAEMVADLLREVDRLTDDWGDDA